MRHTLLEKAYETNELTKGEITFLLETITPEEREILYSRALKTKRGLLRK